jgi:hypothetical protein
MEQRNVFESGICIHIFWERESLLSNQIKRLNLLRPMLPQKRQGTDLKKNALKTLDNKRPISIIAQVVPESITFGISQDNRLIAARLAPECQCACRMAR